MGGISRKLPFIAMSGQAGVRADADDARVPSLPPSFPPSTVTSPSLSPLHVTHAHATVSHLPPGKLRSGPLRRKSNFRSLSPSLVMHSMSSQPRPRSSPPLLICGPSPMWVRHTTFATFLAFFWRLPPLRLSLLPRALLPSPGPRLIKY